MESQAESKEGNEERSGLWNGLNEFSLKVVNEMSFDARSAFFSRKEFKKNCLLKEDME